jgi:spermidine synthase
LSFLSSPQAVLSSRRRPGWAAVALPMLLSGFAGLAYQIVWTLQLGTWLGHEVAAVLAVVAAFFGGLALGAWGLGRRIARSASPGRWYAALELAIAAWALALVGLMPAAGAALTRLIGVDPAPLVHWAWAFGGPLLLLLPATAAMGATLPAMERVLGRLRDEGYAIGGLYALNTAGAVAGTLAAAFWLAPTWGLNATALLAVALNLACAAAAWAWLREPRPPAASAAADPARPTDRTLRPAAPPGPAADRGRSPLARLALGGLLGIGIEVLVVRVLSQLAENTAYTYALLLAIYLLGTAVGAAAYQRWLARRPDTLRCRSLLISAVALTSLLALGALAAGPALRAALVATFGAGFEAAITAEALLGLAAFALPTVAMGALFAQLAVEARAAGWTLGESLAANTLGATLAAPLFGVLLLPVFGAGALLAAIALGYLALMPAPAWRGGWSWAPAAGAAALLVAGPDLRLVAVPEGGRVLSHADGVLAAVTVTEDAEGVRRLHINNREQEGSSATRVSDARQAWIPLLLHPAPASALFLGLGTGVTASAAALDPELQVQAVELLPEVVQAAALFVPALAGAAAPERWSAGAAAPDGASAGALAPRVRDAGGTVQVRVADARRHVRASTARYDVIVADLFHPARSGSGALFTVEHFEAVRARLAPGGLFCQWLPLHQLDLDSLRSIVAAFLAVHPQAVAVLATHSLDTPVVGLVGRAPGLDWRPEVLQARLAAAQASTALAGLQLDDAWAAPGSVLADADALRRFAGDARPNRDDQPVVAYRAPRLRDRPGDGPRERLHALVEQLQADPAAVFGPPRGAGDAAWQARVAAYWAARDHYLAAGTRVRPAADLQRMLAQVREPLLDTLRLSPDFRPAYDPLLRMAQALRRDDPGAARALLAALHDASPDRPEAGDELRRMGGPL